jgi:hypothetical protein
VSAAQISPREAPVPGERARRALPWVLGGVAGAIAVSGAVAFGWMVDETRFERPDARFDALVDDLRALPGVETVESQRWVEVSNLSDPTSWITLDVTAANLVAVDETLCETTYPDPVSVRIRVRTAEGTELVVGNGLEDPVFSAGTCPDLGVDAVGLLSEIDRVVPGLTVDAAVRPGKGLALVAFENAPDDSLTEMLPLVSRGSRLLAAAGMESRGTLLIESPSLSVPLTAEDDAAYAQLLTTLSRDFGVRSFGVAPDAAPPVDGIQIVAPQRNREAIERVIAAADVPASTLKVRFLRE